jgi:hypothetical protein
MTAKASPLNGLIRIFERRVRGIRLVELVGLLLALGMIFWVCLTKVSEGGDVARIGELDSQIAEEEARIKALKVRVSALEQPKRIEALAKQYLGMTTLGPKREANLDNLVEISKSMSRPDKGAMPVSALPLSVQEDSKPTEVSKPPVMQGLTQTKTETHTHQDETEASSLKVEIVP